jgi:hypothetical protein
MKRIIILLTVSIFVTACKTSSHGNCDAYGINDNKNTEEFDIHKISLEQSKKYSSTVSIK